MTVEKWEKIKHFSGADETVNFIFVTKNYKKFHKLKGNRTVNKVRVKKILDSFKAIGVIEVPVIVNEFGEIADGQGRFTVCRDNDLPVYYTVVPGITIEVARKLNTYQTNWKLEEYVESYASEGNLDYVRLNALMEEFSSFESIPVLHALTLIDNVAGGSSRINDPIKLGTFKCSNEEIAAARMRLNAIMPFVSLFKNMKHGRKAARYNALIDLYTIGKDLKVLERKISLVPPEKLHELSTVPNVPSAIHVFDSIYNFRSRKHDYLENDWQRWHDKKGRAGK